MLHRERQVGHTKVVGETFLRHKGRLMQVHLYVEMWGMENKHARGLMRMGA